MTELYFDHEQLEQLLAETVFRGERLTVSGCGNSMAPFICEQTDRVVLAPLTKRTRKAGNICLYKRPNGQLVMHRICRIHGGLCDMRGDNQLYIEHDVAQCQLLAQVVQVIRPKQTVRCDTVRARLRWRYGTLRCFAARIRNRLLKKKRG